MIKTIWSKFVDKVSGGVPRNDQQQDDSSMGHLLIEIGAISSEQLEQAMKDAANGAAGEALIAGELLSRGWVQGSDIDKAMRLQQMFRNGNEMGARMEIAQIKLSEAKQAQARLASAVRGAMPRLETMVSSAQNG